MTEIDSSSEIAWFYNDYTASKDADYLKRIKDNKHFFDSYQFTHIFYNMGEKNSSHFDRIIKILEDTKVNWIRLTKSGDGIKRINKMTIKEGVRKFK